MKLNVKYDAYILKSYDKRGSPLQFYIWWEIGDIFYPKEDWRDFGGVIIDWWIESLMSLLGGNNTVNMLFMDGPYSLCLAWHNIRGQVEIRPKGIQYVHTVRYSAIVDAVLNAADSTCREYSMHNVGAKEIISLRKGIESLKRVALMYEANGRTQ